jgi:hypothetical protein
MNFRDRYFEALGIKERCQRKAALKLAHDIRKFEIELYWKRATYFWAFQLIAFTILGFILKENWAEHLGRLPIPASIGLVTAFAGYLSARGSKFWQENWEAHVDLLEDETEGRLTQVIMCRKPPQFSVSRVNQFLLVLIIAGWTLVLVIGAFPKVAAFLKSCPPPYRGIVILAMVAVACLLMWCFNRTEFTGRMYCVDGTNWTEYPSKRKGTIPFIIWRDPLSEKRARESESSPAQADTTGESASQQNRTAQNTDAPAQNP